MSEQLGREHGDEKASAHNSSGGIGGSGSGSPRAEPKADPADKAPDPPNWIEKGTFWVLVLTFLSAFGAAVEADRLARATEQALADGRLAAYTSHLDAVNAEKLTADAIGQAQFNANGSHADTMAAIARSDTANGISSRSAASAERAWVNPMDVTILGTPVKDQGIKANVSYVNSGREPAEGFIPFLQFAAFTKQEWNAGKTAADITKWANNCFKITYKGQPTTRTVFPSVGGASYNMQGDSADPDYATKITFSDDIAKGDRFIVLEGCFMYRTSGRLHHASFCNWYGKDMPALPHMNICTVGNRAD